MCLSVDIQDLSELLLPVVGEAVLHGLQDVDDDVRAVAAGALLPVANKLYISLPSKVDGNCHTTNDFYDPFVVEHDCVVTGYWLQHAMAGCM